MPRSSKLKTALLPEIGLRPLPQKPIVSQPPQRAAEVIDFRTRTKVGRNDPCPCGSGKKFNRCFGKIWTLDGERSFGKWNRRSVFSFQVQASRTCGCKKMLELLSNSSYAYKPDPSHDGSFRGCGDFSCVSDYIRLLLHHCVISWKVVECQRVVVRLCFMCYYKDDDT